MEFQKKKKINKKVALVPFVHGHGRRILYQRKTEIPERSTSTKSSADKAEPEKNEECPLCCLLGVLADPFLLFLSQKMFLVENEIDSHGAPEREKLA